MDRIIAPGLGQVLSHGMDAELRTPHWPPIAEAELAVLAAQVPELAGELRVLWHSPRPFSAAARVRTGRGEFFIKRHGVRVRDAAALAEEHGFIEHLAARAVPVPGLVRDAAGRSAYVCDGWTYEVHRPAPGVDVYREAHSWTPARSTGHARALGRALAQLHLAARGYDAPARVPRPLLGGFDLVGAHDLERALDEFCALRPALARFLAAGEDRAAIVAALGPWHAALRPLLAGIEPLWVHNDWHASNLFWTDRSADAQVCGVIDFGLANRGCAVADLATALERNAVAWLEQRPELPDGGAIGRVDIALAIVEGYLGVRNLSPAERAGLPPLMALAHIEYALSEADYFHGVVGDDEDARLAVPGFLLGHTRWFERRHGRDFLAALRGAVAPR